LGAPADTSVSLSRLGYFSKIKKYFLLARTELRPKCVYSVKANEPPMEGVRMDDQFDLQCLEKEMWPLKKKFLNVIAPYRSDLWRYCRTLTGSPWDAEDLVQETLMKAFASLGQIWQPLMPKSYLFRIATNAWINQRRRNKWMISEYEDEMHSADPDSAKFEVREAMETLVRHLLPRQAVVILLIDVFDFTARETAEMISASEGAVKATLHRARARLRSLSEGGAGAKLPVEERETPNPQLIHAFIEAFNQRDPEALVALLEENASWDGVHVGQEYGKETSRKYSIADDFKDTTSGLQHAEYRTLWGRPVIVVLTRTESGPQLNDIIYIETEAEKIVLRKHYYFCIDLLTAAAKELNIPVQTDRAYLIE
jgi:RNA polymerase sigma-70 factor (ECF subfamily)